MEYALSQPAGPNGPKKPLGRDSGIAKGREPGWANGLRRLYNSIVDEPLPDSFDDLLKKLDREDDA
jgi:Anti-sigma factor NepR